MAVGDWVRFWIGWRYDFRKWSVVCGGVVLKNDPKWFRLRLGGRIRWNVSGFEPATARVRMLELGLGSGLGSGLGLGCG